MPTHPVTDPTPAPPLRRLLAALYDLLPLAALWYLGAALFLLARGGDPVAPGTPAAWLELAWLIALGFAYFGPSWRHGGRTLGLRAWRLRVVAADGATPSWPALLLRYLLAWVSLAAAGAGFAWILVDRQRRGWHEIASATRTVRDDG
ncbi:MAG TPA: RDD family protein [Xanthomonadaceae bacterium]|nr:RDD family protein [Xanthomonadaceae bacterium]